jgi:hypothetical protein
MSAIYFNSPFIFMQISATMQQQDPGLEESCNPPRALASFAPLFLGLLPFSALFFLAIAAKAVKGRQFICGSVIVSAAEMQAKGEFPGLMNGNLCTRKHQIIHPIRANAFFSTTTSRFFFALCANLSFGGVGLLMAARLFLSFSSPKQTIIRRRSRRLMTQEKCFSSRLLRSRHQRCQLGM